MEKRNSKGLSIGICDIIGVVFIILKLCKVINWSWWWVTAPFWIPISLMVLGTIFAIIVYALGLLANRKNLESEDDL